MTESNQNLAIFSTGKTEMPAFIMAEGSLGNENVSADDMTMPQLKIMQPLSPEHETIAGAVNGKLFNSVSQEQFDSVYAINLNFYTQFTIFKSRQKGGGFFGSYPTKHAADEHVSTLDGNPDDYQVTETAVHELMLLDKDGNPSSPAKMYFKSTSLSASRTWNSMLTTTNNGKPRFSSVWTISSEKKSNTKGTWWVPKATFAGYVTESLFEAAKQQFLANANLPAQ